ncbi:MAG: 3-oxoadipate CoA-transferase [Hyphomicrobiales bacterium]|nr:3-oxoacid CoA-transferase subunit A [Hyphomicrobiales bacterium]PCH50156.1 MAG: 3-oxoadipate CoA-transferase [Hyphomicrobiales bacterium]
MNKIQSSLSEAVSQIKDGATVMIGGFGGSGAPLELIHALIDTGAKDLTIVNNNAGNGDVGLAALIREARVSKLICSFPRSADPKAFSERYLAGKIELEIVPQGTLAERIRAGGAGIPAFYTPTSFGTEVAEGKPVEKFEGRSYVQERWLKADFSIIKAFKGDAMGNLIYRMAGRNFNPLMAMAAKHTIVQVNHVVELGALDPETIVTPGIFVNSVVEVSNPQQEEILNREGAYYPPLNAPLSNNEAGA